MSHVEHRLVTIGYRPHRVAAIVGTLEEAIAAADVYSGVWGGGRNLIVPWIEDGQPLRGLWGILLWQFDPDTAAVSGDVTPQLRQELNRRTRAHIWLLKDLVPGPNYMFQQFEDCVPPALAADCPTGVAVNPGSRVYACARGNPDVTAYTVATLGFIHAEDTERLEAAGATVVQVTDIAEQWSECLNAVFRQDGCLTGRDVTRARLGFTWMSGMSSNKAAVVVSDEPNVSDFALAWDLGCLPGASLSDYLSVLWTSAETLGLPGYLDHLLDAVRRHALSQRGVHPAVDLNAQSLSLGAQRLDEIFLPACRRWSGEKTVVGFGSQANQYGDDEAWQLVFAPNADLLPGRFLEFADTPKRRSALMVDEVIGLEIEPPPWASRERRVAVTYDISADGLHLPLIRELKGVLPSECSASKAGLTFGVHTRRDAMSTTIHWPDPTNALRAAFYAHGFDMGPSDKAVYVRGVVQLLGGIEQCAVLRDTTLAKVLRALNPPRLAALREGTGAPTQTPDLAQEDSLSSYAEDREWRTYQADIALLRERTGLQHAAVVGALDKLSRVNGVVRGFMLLCDNCEISRWYEHAAPVSGFRCEACGHDNPPRTCGSDPQAIANWWFRLSPQLARAVDQGVLPVIQLLAGLYKHHGSRLLYVPGATAKCLPEEEVVFDSPGPVISFRETRRHDVPPEMREAFEAGREIDLIACADGELIVAEVKSSGTRLDGASAKPYLLIAREFGYARVIFACMDDFLGETIESVRNAAEEVGHPFELVEFLGGEQMLDG